MNTDQEKSNLGFETLTFDLLVSGKQVSMDTIVLAHSTALKS